MCLGLGKSDAEKRAFDTQSNLANTLAGIAKQREGLQFPFAQSRVQGGLPFLNQFTDYAGGSLARSLTPERARMTRRLDQYGSALPSGFREQALGDFEARRGRMFDDSLMQGLLLDEETRARAAGLSNPLGYFSSAQSGLQSILGTPQQGNPLGSILGGAVSGLIGLGG